MIVARQRIAPAADKGPSLVDDAYEALKQAVLDSAYPPGHQLSEQELALSLGMSRTPIHEAALRLQADGLVRILPKRGIVVCALAPDDLREIYEVIVAVESAAAARIAHAPGPERAGAVAALRAEAGAMGAALAAGNLAAWGRADAAFHRLLVERCGNTRFARIIATVNDQSHRARMLTLRLRANLDVSMAEHEAIIRAIGNGDGDAARTAAASHRARARDELLPLIASIGLKHL